MNLSIKQLSKLSPQQRKQLKQNYKYRNCPHRYIEWGKCRRCKKNNLGSEQQNASI